MLHGKEKKNEFKKNDIIVGLTALLAACGDSYKTLNIAEKTNLAQKAILEEDEKAKKELEGILKDIEKAAKKGDEKAEFELMTWKEVIENFEIGKKWKKQTKEEMPKGLEIRFDNVK